MSEQVTHEEAEQRWSYVKRVREIKFSLIEAIVRANLREDELFELKRQVVRMHTGPNKLT